MCKLPHRIAFGVGRDREIEYGKRFIVMRFGTGNAWKAIDFIVERADIIKAVAHPDLKRIDISFSDDRAATVAIDSCRRAVDDKSQCDYDI